MFVNYIQTAVEFKMDILVMLIESLVSVFGVWFFGLLFLEILKTLVAILQLGQ